MAMEDDSRPIIIKRKTVVSGGGHHGGAWKVAYADFVTAMMAFFLLMWLLNATTEEQRKGLADYFNPSIPISRTTAGGAGMLAGESIFVPSRLAGSTAQGKQPKPTHHDPGKTVEEDLPSVPDRENGELSSDPATDAVDTEDGEQVAVLPIEVPVTDTETAEAGSEADSPPDGTLRDGTAAPADIAPDSADSARPEEDEDPITDPEAARQLAAEMAERKRLEEIRRKITAAMAGSEDGALQRHFVLHITPEGLVIEIIDADDRPLFASASIRPAPVLELLAEVLVPVLDETLNDIAVVGHTDAVPFGAEGYSNWELSADRANAARRLLLRQGLPERRVVRVTGKAAVEPLVSDPNAPQNRRIALILLREPAH